MTGLTKPRIRVTELSQREIEDLCKCVDIAFVEYKNTISQAETLLETWDFQFTPTENTRAFYLFSVRLELWKLMRKFSKEFDYERGKSEWHLFDAPSSFFSSFEKDYQPTYFSKFLSKFKQHLKEGANYKQPSQLIFDKGGIKIMPRGYFHAYISPNVDTDSPPPDYIDLYFIVDTLNFEFFEEWSKKSWKQSVGSNGFWTAKYTKEWLLTKFIPQVTSLYKKEIKRNSRIDEIKYRYEEDLVPLSPLSKIVQPKDLATYLGDVQLWLHLYPAHNISASLLRSYYKAFTQLATKADPSSVNIDYTSGKLQHVNQMIFGEEPTSEETYDYIINSLRKHTKRISQALYEKTSNADLISRVFIAIIEEGEFARVSQSELNEAKDALLPLWQQYLFSKRYVLLERNLFI